MPQWKCLIVKPKRHVFSCYFFAHGKMLRVYLLSCDVASSGLDASASEMGGGGNVKSPHIFIILCQFLGPWTLWAQIRGLKVLKSLS